MIEYVFSKDAYISEAHVYENGNTLVVYGRVKRTLTNCCDAARGHVDIAVVGQEGLVLGTIGVRYSPRNIPIVRSRSSHFITRFPYPVPAEATLRIAYHNNLDLVNVNGDIFVCRTSAALTEPLEQRHDLRAAGM